jgi:hypothetical protein
MTLPNFLVIGTGRAGTTSLHHYLGQHPDVFVPAVKAPSHFYCIDGPTAVSRVRRLETASFVADRGDYESLFRGAGVRTAVGEVSPAYMASTRVAGRIADVLGHVRLVVVLRDPIERVHARYVARRRDGLERTGSFRALVQAELAAAEHAGGFPSDDTAGTYLASGFVSHVLETYLDRWPADRVHCALFDDLRRDPAAFVGDVFRFLEVDPHQPVDLSTNHNRSGGVIANPVTRAAWTRTAGIRTRVRPHLPVVARDRVFRAVTRSVVPDRIDPDTYATLTDLYRAEVERLAHLIGRDLGSWCTAPTTPSDAR